MDLRYMAQLEMELNGRKYFFVMPVGAPFVDCREVLVEALKGINEMEKQAMANVEVQKTSEEVN